VRLLAAALESLPSLNVFSRVNIAHEWRILLLALAAGLPAVLTSMIIVWSGDYTPKVQWTLSVVILGAWWGFCAAVKERVASPLRTLANLLEAMREGDYSIRARGAPPTEPLGEVMSQVNAMATTLRAQRLGALEATTLLRKVMEEIDVAVFAFDSERKLKLVNRAGERLLNQPAERIMNALADELDLSEFLDGEDSQTIQRTFPAGSGRWSVHRASFREGGLPHQLLVITDLTRALREEELQAWQRLVRVLGHELNNSLAPIKSIAGSLETIVMKEPKPEDWQDDMRRGLQVIASRSESLSRFMSSYARMAKLPKPVLAPLNVHQWVEHAAALEQRLEVTVEPGPELTIPGDRAQLDQVLINLIKNAVEATEEARGSRVRVSWIRNHQRIEVYVRDEGPGLSNTANLFVPFFTTKPGGSGIGLVLSRQIAEAHGGGLELRNRTDVRGCEARLILPVERAS
jgi:nitrogen fixation/metabolism regulation signal transduction histidine kinase